MMPMRRTDYVSRERFGIEGRGICVDGGVGFKFFYYFGQRSFFFEKGRHAQVIFGFASGLREAAPVRLAGVEVGLVKKLQVYVDEADGGKPRSGQYLDQRRGGVPRILISRSISWGFWGRNILRLSPAHRRNWSRMTV
jgi:hypothetical protein